jgi:enoyl-CoA hydratase
MPLAGPDILLYEKKEGIVTITLNRPERRNALSYELMERLADAFERYRDDDDALVAVVCGVGQDFCAGADLKEAESGTTSKEMFKRPGPRFIRGIDIWKPMIAAIQGYAVAGGWLLAQRCDIRIASEDAEFGITEAKWNLPAGWVCDLTRQLHLGHALEIVLWGDQRITAQRGYEMGWINRVVPREKLMDEAMSWAERMTYMGPAAVSNLKETLYQGFYLPQPLGYELASALEEGIVESEDAKEGLRAFKEKRKPQFKRK